MHFRHDNHWPKKFVCSIPYKLLRNFKEKMIDESKEKEGLIEVKRKQRGVKKKPRRNNGEVNDLISFYIKIIFQKNFNQLFFSFITYNKPIYNYHYPSLDFHFYWY